MNSLLKFDFEEMRREREAIAEIERQEGIVYSERILAQARDAIMEINAEGYACCAIEYTEEVIRCKPNFEPKPAPTDLLVSQADFFEINNPYNLYALYYTLKELHGAGINVKLVYVNYINSRKLISMGYRILADWSHQ